MSAIFQAFNRHGIACGTPAIVDSGCSVAPTAAPNVTILPLDRGASLSWNVVANAGKYMIFRTDGVFQCNFGKVKVGETTGLTFIDSGLKNGHTYYYVVMAVGTDDTCMGPASACAPVSPVAGSNLTLDAATVSLTLAGDDGDMFVDNCEMGKVGFDITNTSTGTQTNVRITGVTVSPSDFEIKTLLPSTVVGSLAPCASVTGMFDFTAKGLAYQDTIRFTVEVTSDQLSPITRTLEIEIPFAETDLRRWASHTFDFETGLDGWTVTDGTFTRDSTGGGAAGTSWYLASSANLPDQCDAVRSPIVALSSTSTLGLFHQFDIEDFFTPGVWYDRANVGLVDFASGVRTPIDPDGGLLYNASGANGTCGTDGQNGWAGLSPVWNQSTWSSAGLGAAAAPGQKVRLDVRYGTDFIIEGSGFHFDEVTLTDVDIEAADLQSNACMCDNNGVCDFHEDCAICPGDCMISTAVCGNGVCEAGDGEDCINCAADCAGVQGGKPSGRFCCGAGGGTNPVLCSDSRCTTGGFACTNVSAPLACVAPVISEVWPAVPAHRVHDLIAISGSGFGSFQPGVSKVLWSSGTTTIEAGTPYVWRDDFIQVRVPAGDFMGGVAVPIPTVPLTLQVLSAQGPSAAVPFQVMISANPLPPFVELSLGDPARNMARTKDGEVGDVDGDHYPDLLDTNSRNILNMHFSVLRTNNFPTTGIKSFTPIDFEPLVAGTPGVFATTILNGIHMDDNTSYDADFVDLDNDRLPDVVQALRNDGNALRLVRVLLNNNGGPGLFLEDTPAWITAPSYPGDPDDVAHTDLDHDGFVDVGIAYRSSISADLFFNQNGTTFGSTQRLNVSGFSSVHDVFFLDADDNGFQDVMLVNELGTTQLFLHNGATPPAFTVQPATYMSAHTGVTADFNGDGVADFALAYASNGTAAVFLNDNNPPPAAPTFTQVNLTSVPLGIYDLGAGDVDLDGEVDLIGAAINSGSGGVNAIRIWQNNGGAFTPASTALLLPTIGAYERLSADLLDLDLDGDLDLYITGADCQDAFGGMGCSPPPQIDPKFGRVPNQLFENLLIP